MEDAPEGTKEGVKEKQKLYRRGANPIGARPANCLGLFSYHDDFAGLYRLRDRLYMAPCTMMIPVKQFDLHLAAACFLLLAVSLGAAETPDVTVASLSKGAMVPDAEVDAGGQIHVAYLLEDDVFYVRSGDAGMTFSEPVRVNTEPGFASGAAFRGPDLALGQDGGVHIIWYNAGYQQKRPKDEWGVMYARLDDSTGRFEKARNLNHRPSDNFSLATGAQGKVAVIWMAEGIFASVSEDGGETFAPAVDLELDPCECCSSRAIYSKDGSLSVLYRDKTDDVRDTNIATLAAGASQWLNRKISQTPWQTTSCPMTGSFLSLTKSGLAAAWETKLQPYFAMIDPESKETEIQEVRAAEKGRYPVVLVSSDGRKLVAWKNGKQLEWQSFDSNNAPMGEQASHASESPHRPGGVVLDSGKFILFP